MYQKSILIILLPIESESELRASSPRNKSLRFMQTSFRRINKVQVIAKRHIHPPHQIFLHPHDLAGKNVISMMLKEA